MTPLRISPRDRDALLQALRSGVVPRRGLHHIQVGREQELRALLGDLDRIVDGGSAVRFLIADYGAGKTFLASLFRQVAMEKACVVMHADLNPDRRLYGAGGQGRSLYNELARNIATRAKPEGAAMVSIVEKFIASAMEQQKAGGEAVQTIIDARLHSLRELVNGPAFAKVIECYWIGHQQGNETLKANAIRWLRGEFSTRTESKNALEVRDIIDDDQVFDTLKLMARFVHLAGYAGLVVVLDELVNLYKLPQANSRTQNYEHVLRIINDIHSGSAVRIGVVFGGTPATLTDARRGLYSYEALQSRLAENAFAAKVGVNDFGGPVLRLANLTPEDLFVLLIKIRDVAGGEGAARMGQPEIAAFLKHCHTRIGAAYFQTPRNTVRAFLDLLAVLGAKPELTLGDVLDGVEVAHDADPDTESPNDDGESDELTAFRL